MYVRDSNKYYSNIIYTVRNPEDVPPTVIDARIARVGRSGSIVGGGLCRVVRTNSKTKTCKIPKASIECVWDTLHECFIAPA